MKSRQAYPKFGPWILNGHLLERQLLVGAAEAFRRAFPNAMHYLRSPEDLLPANNGEVIEVWVWSEREESAVKVCVLAIREPVIFEWKFMFWMHDHVSIHAFEMLCNSARQMADASPARRRHEVPRA